METAARPAPLPAWLGQAVCYEVPVPAFADSDGDGVGDLPGLAARLDYLDWLGVDCLWLTGTHGAPADLADLLDAAHARGMRVLAELPADPADALRTARGWLELGLDGIRLDAGAVSADFLRHCRRMVAGAAPDAALLATGRPAALLPSILRGLREGLGWPVAPLIAGVAETGGLRIRRPAPLVGNDRKRLELCAALLLSLPGVPVIYYGDEIGMAGHDGRPTPMQWTGGHNAGFSDCPAARLHPPLVADAVYGYRAVNVESQRANRSSLLNWLREMIAARRENPVLCQGGSVAVRSSNPRVLAYRRHHDDSHDLICAYSLSAVPQPFQLDLRDHRGAVPVELTGGIRFPQIKDTPYQLTLPGYGFYWLSVARPGSWAGARAA